MKHGAVSDQRELVGVLNTYKSDNPEQVQEFFDAYVTDAVFGDYQDPGSAISEKFRGLDLDHTIAGTSIAGYAHKALHTADEGKNPFKMDVVDKLGDFFLSNTAKVTKGSSITDKDMAVDRVVFDVHKQPRSKKDAFVDGELSKFVDQKYTENVIATSIFDPMGTELASWDGTPRPHNDDNFLGLAFARKNIQATKLSTVLDHTINKHGVDAVSNVFNKVKSTYSDGVQRVAQSFMKGRGAENGSQSMGLHLLGSMRDPEKMHQVMQKTDTVPQALELPLNKRTTAVMDGWGRGSGHGMGALLRKSISGSTGMKINDSMLQHTQNKGSAYPNRELSRDQIPAPIAESAQHIHTMSKEYIKANNISSGTLNGDPVTMYRGLHFNDRKGDNVTVGSSVSSVSIDKGIASSFAYGGDAFGTDASASANVSKRYDRSGKGVLDTDRIADQQKLSFSKGIEPYVDSVSRYKGKSGNERGYLLHMNFQKLVDDNKVYSVFSGDSFMFMQDQHNVAIPKIFFEFNDEHEFLITA